MPDPPPLPPGDTEDSDEPPVLAEPITLFGNPQSRVLREAGDGDRWLASTRWCLLKKWV